MIDTEILRRFGWSDELIENVVKKAVSLRETASKIPEIHDLVHHEMVVSDSTYPGGIEDQSSVSNNECRVR